MSKSALVKVGLPSEQAEGVRRIRRIRQILDQHDAAVARLNAVLDERIREWATADDVAEEEPTAATA